MKLGKIEKWFINKESHSKKVIEKAEKLLAYLDMNPKFQLLEIGSGAGAVSIYLAEKHKVKITGTDIDSEQINIAKEKSKKIKNVTFLEADAVNLPFKNQHFDVILSINVLHHISNWMGALKEITRVLKKDGYLILVELLFTKWTELIGKIYSKQNYGVTTKANLDKFINYNNYALIHYNLSNALMWKNIEAIYKE
jgi:ubiquinone/menaquinone biosynthesis C-methylase UbiE